MDSLSMRRRFLVFVFFVLSSLGIAFQATAQNKPPLRIGFSMALTGTALLFCGFK